MSIDEERHTTAMVTDNGHGIEVTPKEGGKITVNGEQYKLLEFHFHGKSENTVNEVHFDLEMQMVHQNAEGQLLVLSVMFLEGDNNPVLDNILGNITETIRIDPADILPKDRRKYYHWIGSLSTPPCTEDVQWYLLKKPLSASKDQIDAFRSYYKHNYRPTQPLNGRKVERK